jgi:hypothetical protein
MTWEESPDNKEQRTSEREDVREGIEAEKKITSCCSKDEGPPSLKLRQVKVRRQGKSLPAVMVTLPAVRLTC